MNVLMLKTLILTFSLFTISATADELKNNLKNKAENKFYNNLSNYSQNLASALADKISSNERIKYLDISLDLQEKLKPSYEIQSVNKLSEDEDSVWFNQTNLTSHDSDTTINFGIGRRQLMNNETIMTGFNGFLDYQFDEEHFRKGIGFEAVSDTLDLIGNYYDGISGFKKTDEGKEKALDGFDLKLNFHLPNSKNTDLFAQLFQWENPSSTYKEEGEKIGFSTVVGNFSFTAGYLDDNKNNDGYFGSLKLFIPLGGDNNIKTEEDDSKLSIRDKLYMPVQRENKIKVVRVSSGVQVGGF